MAKTNATDKHIVEETKRNGDSIGGRILMSDDVVATIAGLAARDIQGIHALGKSRLMSFGDSPTRGVEAEVGKREAALDIEVILDHGADVREMASELRHKIAEEVDRMAGRKVVEVNLDVVGIHLPDREPKETDSPRVR